MKDTVIILLAAGSSTRMGQPKQLLQINDEQLLLLTAKTAIKSGMQTIVVLGSNQEIHQALLKDLPLKIVTNNEWENGMGSSVRAGIKYILDDLTIGSVIVTVCDQPLLTSDHLNEIKKSFESSDKLIVASFYSNTAGVPALFDCSLFSEMMNLPDEHGAKQIIRNHLDKTEMIDFPDGAIDLDTPEDVRLFLDKPRSI